MSALRRLAGTSARPALRTCQPLRTNSLRSRGISTAQASQTASRNVPKPAVFLASALALSFTTYTLGTFFPPPLVTLISPRSAPPAPPLDSVEGKAHVVKLETQLQSLPFLTEFRSKPEYSEWYETRPYVDYPEDKRVNSLTAGALAAPGKLALPPLILARRDEKESMILIHVGRGICGHDGIIHGGLIATLLDETLARTAMMNLPSNIAVTANLSVDYRAPTRADQFIVIKTTLTEQKGRKAVVLGRVEDLDGTLLAEAKGIFVEPKYANMLNAKGLVKAIGGPPPASSA